MKIYLDNAATTMMDGRVARFVHLLNKQELGNASSGHRCGLQAAIVIENARQAIAKAINTLPQEIYFFSGGTEANNTVIKGIAFARQGAGHHIIVSAIEHPSVLGPVRWLEGQGFHITYVGVDRQGLVDPADVRKSITKKTLLVSIMHANNEIGTIEPVRAIGYLCRQQGVYFHTDICQSFTKVPIDVRRDCLDLATLSSHKIHGPNGVAALYIRRGVKIGPLLHGGDQENGMRAGTYDTQGIAGFGKAVEITDRRDVDKMLELRDYFIKKIEKDIDGALLNGSRQKRLCNNVNYSFRGVDGKGLFTLLNKKNIFVSTGSACSSNKLAVSHVLEALNIGQDRAHGALRMTLSKWTTKNEIDAAVKDIKICVSKIRKDREKNS